MKEIKPRKVQVVRIEGTPDGDFAKIRVPADMRITLRCGRKEWSFDTAQTPETLFMEVAAFAPCGHYVGCPHDL